MKKYVSFLLIILIFLLTACSKPSVETYKGVLMELDPDNNILWENYDFPDPMCFNKDKQGNRLVIDKSKNMSIAYSPDHKEIWAFFNGRYNYIERTEDGTYLLSNNDTFSPSVVEMNDLAEPLWQIENLPYISMIHKLQNGNYLLTSREEHVVKEIDSNHNVLWASKKGIFNQPYSVQVLDDGNYLITDFDNHRVVIIDKDSKILWKSLVSLNHPKFAVRLNNDHYVIADVDNKRLIFIDKDSNILHERRNINITGLNLTPDGNIAVSGGFLNLL